MRACNTFVSCPADVLELYVATPSPLAYALLRLGALRPDRQSIKSTSSSTDDATGAFLHRHNYG
jgi:hypothetical protein